MGLQEMSQLVDNVASHFSFRFLLIFFLTLFRNNRYLVVIRTECGSRIANRVKHDEIGIFLFAFFLCISLFIVGFQGESTIR